METFAIPVDTQKIATYCRHWKIRKLSVFGSILRNDSSEKSPDIRNRG